MIEKLTKLGYLNTTVLRSNSKGLPSKIKLPGYDNAHKNEILIQKYEDKKTIYFVTNYSIEKEDLKNLYNLKIGELMFLINVWKSRQFKEKQKNGIKNIFIWNRCINFKWKD